MFKYLCGICKFIILVILVLGFGGGAWAQDAAQKNSFASISEFAVKFDKFEYCTGVNQQNGSVWSPVAEKDAVREYEKRIQLLISEAGGKYGYKITEKSNGPVLIVAYSDSEESGVKAYGGAMTAFKKYNLVLSLTAKNGTKLAEKTYEDETEDVGMNVPFSFDKVEESIRKNLDVFFKTIKKE